MLAQLGYTLLVGATLAASPAFAADGAFGHIGIKAPKIESIPKWVAVLERTKSQHNILHNCLTATQACQTENQTKWRRMMLKQNGRSAKAQLNAVNDFFNNYPYITDDKLYGRSDVWATPVEFLAMSGDCEDYSIAKYVSLKMLGFPESTLRMFVVHDSVRGIAHAVLGATAGGTEYVLDNLASTPIPTKFALQYKPYYAVNANYRWVFVQPLKP
jgi:predicted transglutaminase-like cysteine proteinase